jgi:hypothetical protein
MYSLCSFEINKASRVNKTSNTDKGLSSNFLVLILKSKVSFQKVLFDFIFIHNIQHDSTVHHGIQ